MQYCPEAKFWNRFENGRRGKHVHKFGIFPLTHPLSVTCKATLIAFWVSWAIDVGKPVSRFLTELVISPQFLPASRQFPVKFRRETLDIRYDIVYLHFSRRCTQATLTIHVTIEMHAHLFHVDFMHRVTPPRLADYSPHNRTMNYGSMPATSIRVCTCPNIQNLPRSLVPPPFV